MDDDKWSIDLSSTSSSRAYQHDPKFLSDLCIDFESVEDTDEYLMAYHPCPYCEEEFDLVELCCHIDDEHQFESKSEMCPVCGLNEAMDMVGHITSQHGDMFKISLAAAPFWFRFQLRRAHSLQKLKRRKGDLQSSLKKDADDDEFSVYSRRCATIVSHTDPFLSFIQSMPSLDKAEDAQPSISTLIDSEKGKPEDKQCESVGCHPPLSVKEHTEKIKRSEFVQGLLLSTMFSDDL
ncbi:Protein DEHYDRATION-INDUCED 19 homolog 6 [Linum grandiflorum]